MSEKRQMLDWFCEREAVNMHDSDHQIDQPMDLVDRKMQTQKENTGKWISSKSNGKIDAQRTTPSALGGHRKISIDTDKWISSKSNDTIDIQRTTPPTLGGYRKIDSVYQRQDLHECFELLQRNYTRDYGQLDSALSCSPISGLENLSETIVFDGVVYEPPQPETVTPPGAFQRYLNNGEDASSDAGEFGVNAYVSGSEESHMSGSSLSGCMEPFEKELVKPRRLSKDRNERYSASKPIAIPKSPLRNSSPRFKKKIYGMEYGASPTEERDFRHRKSMGADDLFSLSL